MSAVAPPVSADLTVSLVRDGDELNTLRTEWESLEDRAEHFGLYVTWSYVQLAWLHFSSPGDELFVVTVREGGQLVGVLPLVRVPERHYGMTLRVLRHIGIWEGERPGVLSLDRPDRIWAAAWDHLKANRAEWQVLDLRELDADAWPLRELVQPGGGFSSESQPDIKAPYQRLDSTWPLHLALRTDRLRAQRALARQRLAAAMPGLCVAVAEQPEDVPAAFDRYLALEQALVAQDSGVTIGRDPRCVAFYRDWLPRLAARGDAAVWLLGGDRGEVAGLIRLRCGDVWIERHACFDPAHAELTPSLLLAIEALQHSFGTTAEECDVVCVREPAESGATLRDWFDDRRATQRLSVWNLHSRLAPVAFLRGLGNRFKGG